MFDNTIVWEFIPGYSVFLVFWLSFLRTFALLYPLVFIKKRVVIGVLIGYAIFMITRLLFGVVTGYSSYKYETFSGYCWNHISNKNYQVNKLKLNTLK